MILLCNEIICVIIMKIIIMILMKILMCNDNDNEEMKEVIMT